MAGIRSRGSVGHVAVPNWRTEDPTLDPFDFRVAVWLFSHADTWREGHVRRNTIAERLGIAGGRVTKSLERLTELGIISIEGGGKQGAGMVITVDKDVWRTGPEKSPHDYEKSPHDYEKSPHDFSGESLLLYREEQLEEQLERVAASQLATSLADCLEARGCKRPTITERWITDMQRLITIDARDPHQIAGVIRWLHDARDPIAQFWQPNIRTPGKLRSQWDQMAEQHRRHKQTGQPSGGSVMDRIQHATANGGLT